MNELKEILESSVLTDEVKTKLQEAFESQVNEKVAAREVELAEKFENSKKELAQSAVEMIEEAVTEEFKALQDEIVEARTLDVRYASKLEEFKEQYAQKKDAEIKESVDAIIAEELGELKESLEESRKNLVGQRMFEAFQTSYASLVKAEDDKSEELTAKLEEATNELQTLRVEKKTNELLEGLTGRKRAIMATLLEGVALDKLESRYEELAKSVVLSEGEGSGDDEDDGEGKDKDNLNENVDDKTPKGTVVIENQDQDGDAKPNTKAWLKHARRLAGVDD